MIGSRPRSSPGWRETLQCAALDHNLRTVLLLDADDDIMALTATHLTAALKLVTKKTIRTFTLTAAISDELLWGGHVPHAADGTTQLHWDPGILAESAENEMRIILVPELSRLASHVMRACTLLVGADVGHIERHGYTAVWSPCNVWLASCKKSCKSRISPHLLDRFALTLDAANIDRVDRLAAMQNFVHSNDTAYGSNESHEYGGLSKIEKERLDVAATRLSPVLTIDAADRLVDRGRSIDGHRLEIAFARLARAHARLNGDSSVTVENVEAAATMLKLSSEDSNEPQSPAHSQTASTVDKSVPIPAPQFAVNPMSAQAGGTASDASSTIEARVPDTTQIENGSLKTRDHHNNPNIQQQEKQPSEALSLRPPNHRARTACALFGQIVGVQPAKELRDIAVVATVVESVKFRRVREQFSEQSRYVKTGNAASWPIWPADFRSYRRSPSPEHLLVLVLDTTSLAGWNWQGAIAPYLRQAYVDRSAIGVIQVGQGEGAEQLRARRAMARNLLVPALARSFETERGKATPLAHGLELAWEVLRRAAYHRVNAKSRIQLVVVSDGRGNVPLVMSYAGRITGRVRNEGVEDALRMAERIRAIEGVNVDLVDPMPVHHADLPRLLARALGASVRARRVDAPTDFDEDEE